MAIDTTVPGSIFADPEAYADPESWHREADRIRAESPMLRVELDGFPPFWAIARHADVMAIERAPEIFTNAPIPTLAPLAGLSDIENVPVKTLIQMDGDHHRDHRAIVNDWFRPKSLRRVQDAVDELARKAIDDMIARDGSCDFVADVALHFPLRVILSILGLPEHDFDRMLTLTQELFGAEDADLGRLAEDDGALSVLMDFVSYFTDLATDRRTCPTEDLASVIANAELDGEPIADLDMLGHFVIIATAGHDTTSNAISGGLLALLDQPDQLEKLAANPDLIDHAADEIVRYTSPVKHFMRNCQEPHTIGDTSFEPGDLLYLSFAAANRDPEVFENPHDLDVERANAAEHLGFGFGRHFCLGAHLARMEIRALFKELLARIDQIEYAGEPSWITSYFVQGPKSIPIRYRVR